MCSCAEKCARPASLRGEDTNALIYLLWFLSFFALNLPTFKSSESSAQVKKTWFKLVAMTSMIKINGSGIFTYMNSWFTIQSWILWAWWEKPSKPGWNSLFESQKLSSLTHGSIGRTAGFGDHSESLIIKKMRNKTWKSDCWLTLHLGI